MKDRRSLMEGLNNGSDVDRSVEEEFVFAGEVKPDQPTHSPTLAQNPKAGEVKRHTGNIAGRVPLTTRVRSDFALVGSL